MSAVLFLAGDTQEAFWDILTEPSCWVVTLILALLHVPLTLVELLVEG